MIISENLKIIDIIPWKDEPDYVYLIDATKSVYEDVDIYHTSYTKKEGNGDIILYDSVKLASDVAQNVINSNPGISWYSSYDERRDMLRISGHKNVSKPGSACLGHTMIVITINRGKIVHLLPQKEDGNAENI